MPILSSSSSSSASTSTSFYFLSTLTICVLFHGEKHRKTLAYAVSVLALSLSLPLGWMSCKLSFHIRGFQNAFNNAWPHSVWVNPRDKHARSSSVQGRVCVCVCGRKERRERGRDRQIVSQLGCLCVCVGDSFGILPTYNGSGNTTYTTLAASAQSRFYCLTIMYIWLPC